MNTHKLIQVIPLGKCLLSLWDILKTCYTKTLPFQISDIWPVVSRFRPHWDALCEETGVPSPFPSRHPGLPVNRKSIHLLAGVEIYWPSQLCCVVLCQCNVLCSVMARRFVSRCFVLCRVYFIVLHCIVLYCIVLYCILSYFPISSSMFSQSW